MNIDIVIPAHNEEHRIGPTLDAYLSAFPDPAVHLHVAMDGCSDGTAEVVADRAMSDGRITLHEYPKLGKGGVLMEAFRRTRGNYVAFVDADGATPPSELKRLLVAMDDADVAIASRYHPAAVTPGSRSLARRLASAGFAATVRRLFQLPYVDTQCGAKVLRRQAVERVVPLLSSHDFVFDVDLLLAAQQCGFRVVEVPTIWIDRGGSKMQVARDGRRMLASVFRLWVHHRVMPIEVDEQGQRELTGAESNEAPRPKSLTHAA